MNILVTGCAGFIGSSLCERLFSNCENNIIGIDNFDENYEKNIKIENIKTIIKNKNFYFIEGDIRDDKLLKSLFSKYKFDLIIHLAAKTGVRTSLSEPAEYVSVNINGTVNILENIRKHTPNAKFIFASSSSVYGNHLAQKFSENLTNLKPISPYAITKKSCEEFTENYSALYGINAICLRFFTVYGPRQRPDLAIHKFSKAILHNEPVLLFGNGTTYRDYTYIDDITGSILKSIDYSQSKFEIINIGSDSPVTLKQLVEYLEEILDKKAIIKHLPTQKGDVNRTIADISKAEKLLKYKPEVPFKLGLKRFIEFTYFRKQ